MSEGTKMSSGSGTDRGYIVEVRCSKVFHRNPIRLHDGIVTTEWRQLGFVEGHNPAGIPQPRFSELPRHGLLELNAATALAWTVIAQQHRQDGLECRLVAVDVAYSYALTRKGVVDAPAITSLDYRNVAIKEP